VQLGIGLTANNGNYVFVQDPSNATTLTVNVSPNASATFGVLQEPYVDDGAFDPVAEGEPTRQVNALGLDMVAKRCLLGEASVAQSAACKGQGSSQ